ncbi:hypothetical protein BJY59DRAFT_704954 [Rhodotorula toruloides]
MACTATVRLAALFCLRGFSATASVTQHPRASLPAHLPALLLGRCTSPPLSPPYAALQHLQLVRQFLASSRPPR